MSVRGPGMTIKRPSFTSKSALARWDTIWCPEALGTWDLGFELAEQVRDQ